MTSTNSNSITEQDLYKALGKVILPEDEVIVMYAGIWTFGQYLPWPVRELPDRLLDIIENFVGAERTLLFPAFCASEFVRSRVFDLALTKPKESGILPERALARPGYKRLVRPLHSFVVKGRRADEVLALENTTSWGKGSILDWMGRSQARVCTLGLPWNKACSYFHRIEERVQVPYRYYKRFAGTLFDKGVKLGLCEEIKYSYSLRVPLRYDYSIVQQNLLRSGRTLSSENHLLPLESAKTGAIDKVCDELFQDPYAVILNSDEVKNWVKNGRRQEIEELAPDTKCSLNN